MESNSVYRRFVNDISVDLLVAGDSLALEFIKKTQDQLFNGIPILVLGMEKGEKFNEALRMMSTHIVLDSPYIEENIKLINSLFPRRRKILFLGCSDDQNDVLKAVDFKFDIDSEFKNIAGMTVEQLKQYSAGLCRFHLEWCCLYERQASIS